MDEVYLLGIQDFEDFKNLKLLNLVGFPHLKRYEPIILASLISREPAALIGLPGHGKKNFIKNLASLFEFKYLIIDSHSEYAAEDLLNKDKIYSILDNYDLVVIDYLNDEKPELDGVLYSLINRHSHVRQQTQRNLFVWGIFQDFLQYSRRFEWFTHFIKFEKFENLTSAQKEQMLSRELVDSDLVMISDFREIFFNMKKKIKKKNSKDEVTILEEIDSDNVIRIDPELKNSLIRCALTAADGFQLKGFKITPKWMKNFFYNLFLYIKMYDLFMEEELEVIIDGSLPYSVEANPEYREALYEVTKKAFYSFQSNEHTLLDNFINETNFERKFEILLKAQEAYGNVSQFILSILKDSADNMSAENKMFLYTVFPLLLKGKIVVDVNVLKKALNILSRFYSYREKVDSLYPDKFVGFGNGRSDVEKILNTYTPGRRLRAKMAFKNHYSAHTFLPLENEIEKLVNLIRINYSIKPKWEETK